MTRMVFGSWICLDRRHFRSGRGRPLLTMLTDNPCQNRKQIDLKKTRFLNKQSAKCEKNSMIICRLRASVIPSKQRKLQCMFAVYRANHTHTTLISDYLFESSGPSFEPYIQLLVRCFAKSVVFYSNGVTKKVTIFQFPIVMQ